MTTVAAIETMDRAQLIALWHDIFGDPPPKSLSRPFLRSILAFEIQVRATSGLPKGFVAKLEGVAGEDAPKRSPELQPGGRLFREWNGVTHVVDVTGQGFHWRNQTWRSFSAIAREIIGAYWSGPRFFGLSRRADG